MSATPLRPVVLTVASSTVLTINDAVTEWLTEGYPVGEVVAVRGVLLVLMLRGPSRASLSANRPHVDRTR